MIVNTAERAKEATEALDAVLNVMGDSQRVEPMMSEEMLIDAVEKIRALYRGHAYLNGGAGLNDADDVLKAWIASRAS